MQRQLTWFLFGSALCLFTLIYFVDSRLPGTAELNDLLPQSIQRVSFVVTHGSPHWLDPTPSQPTDSFRDLRLHGPIRASSDGG